MKNKTKHLYLLSALLVLAVLFTGCSIREDNTDCPRPFRLFLKAHDADGKDITQDGEVKQVVLFVFNEKQELVEAIVVSESDFRNGKPINIALDYPGHQSLTFVAWGNVDSSIEFPPTNDIDQWSDLYAKLNSSNGVAQSPGAIFYGSETIQVEYGGIEAGGDQVVIMTHRTAQVNIVAKKLQQWNDRKEGEYEFRLKQSFDTIDKDGNFTGSEVMYIPLAKMEDGTLSTSIFNTFPPTGTTYTLEILFEGEVIYTATVGTDGVPFTPELGRMLNIIIDFGGTIDVKVVVTPWNQVYQFVEM